MLFDGKLMSGAFRPLVTLKWSNGYLIVLRLMIGLLLVLLIVLFWLLRQNERDEQRLKLIADVLWLEQSINFHLEGTAENLRQLSNELPEEENKQALLYLRGGHLLKNNPDILQIVWVNEAGSIRESVPTDGLFRLEGEGNAEEDRNMDMARKLGKSVFTDTYSTPDGAQFEIYSPIFDNGRYRGALIGVVSLNALLRNSVPWWFVEKYQVRILDDEGKVLASRSRLNGADTTIDYAIPLDPPGFGIQIRVDAYRSHSNSTQNTLTAAVIVLAAAVLFSLQVMRRHIQRRIDAEQAHRSEHLFRKAMEDSLMVGMRARDLNGKVTYVNSAFCQMLGFGEEELLGAHLPLPYWAPEEMERTRQIYDIVIAGEAPRKSIEVRLMRKDGKRIDVLVYEAPLIDADGQHTGWMASFVDVTARRQAEELARQQQEKLQATSRLVTMGELASTLAHELNQPLAAIASYTTGCLNRLESGRFAMEEMKGVLVKLGVQTQRAGRIIRRIHDFVRKSEPRLSPCNLIDVVEDSIGLIEPATKLAHVRIEREYLIDPPTLMGDAVMIEQVLLNLMRNALEAMSMEPIPLEKKRLTVRIDQARDQVRISIVDRGTGIPREIQDKLFTPFFSTKPDGMGMGLNICRSIIEFHGGRLWIEDNPEGGAILTISLPITQP